MPRLFHQPPKYCLHKGTKQAVVYLNGKRLNLGPHGSAPSHRRYQEFLEEWQKIRHEELKSDDFTTRAQAVADSVTTISLREKRGQGVVFN